MSSSKYTPIIGLEIHVELCTKSKMFCQCEADYFGKAPNTFTCPVCLGMPGGLPVPNEKAIEGCIQIGKALGCRINNNFKFDRKHYFYGDLPKGYQISQYDEPIAEEGEVEIYLNGTWKKFQITRVHMEEDTGKLSHQNEDSYIDYNRSGVPLVEIVTEPCFRSGEEAKAFLEELQNIVRNLGVAKADMEKGDMRLEPNISVQVTSKLPELPPYKVEVKNINSFKFAQKAIDFEIQRHTEILETGEFPVQETRGWDLNNNVTVSQRIKETAKDYRYFPDPDIPKFEYSDEKIVDIVGEMTELPSSRLRRYMEELNLKEQEAFFISREKELSEYFEEVTSQFDGDAQVVANFIKNKKISTKDSVEDALGIIEKETAPTETDEGLLEEVISKVFEEQAKAIEDFKSGKNPNAIGFLIGQVMRGMQGKADANTVREALQKKLG